MARFNCITFILLLLFSTQSSALNLSRIDQPLEDGIYDNRSCNDLYLQASALEQDTLLVVFSVPIFMHLFTPEEFEKNAASVIKLLIAGLSNKK